MLGVDVIIVNWNSGPLLARCLAALSGTGARPIVVDNASTDGSEAGARVAGVTLISNSRNLGFAAACNAGVAQGNGDYLLFLNPDATISTGDLNRLVEQLRLSEPAGFGIAGPLLCDLLGRAQPSCSDLPRFLDLAGRMIGLDRIGLVRSALHLPARSGPVGQIMGAALLISRALFDRLGGFDDRYFLYFEDLDLASRAQALGFRSLFVREVTAVHDGHGSSGQIKSRRLLLWLRSRHRFAQQRLGPGSALALFVLALIIEPFARITSLAFEGRVGEIPGALWAHLRFGLAPGGPQ